MSVRICVCFNLSVFVGCAWTAVVCCLCLIVSLVVLFAVVCFVLLVDLVVFCFVV